MATGVEWDTRSILIQQMDCDPADPESLAVTKNQSVLKILIVVDGLQVGGTERSLAEFFPHLIQAEIKRSLFNRRQSSLRRSAQLGLSTPPHLRAEMQ